jgi:hypothetical protein
MRIIIEGRRRVPGLGGVPGFCGSAWKGQVRSLLTVLLLVGPVGALSGQEPVSAPFEPPPPRVVFTTSIDYAGQVPQIQVLARSIRAFGGSLASAPVWVYVPEGAAPLPDFNLAELRELGVEVRSFPVPSEVLGFFLGGKPYAAAQAEADAAGEADLLILLAPNTLVLADPTEMVLPAGKDLAFSPVHHTNVGSWYEAPPDEWWGRIYQVLGIRKEDLWPMETLADRRILRPYFSSGSLVVRPEKGLMAGWARAFREVAVDPEIAAASAEGSHNTFLHQAALAGALVRALNREEMLQLSFRYNYPLFFDRFFGAVNAFDSLEEVATMRYEFSFDDLPEGWRAGVRAPPGVLDWITAQLGGPPR